MEPVTIAPFAQTLTDALGMTWVLVIFIAPIALGFLFFEAFVTMRKNSFTHDQKSILLELKLPRELPKSPLAMELFLSTLYQTSGEATWIDRWIKGKQRPWFSLELVSIEGEIKFFIWSWEVWRRHIESQLYAQFPTIEIKRVEDYSSKIHYGDGSIELWGTPINLDKPDYYPIKTYVDYELDKNPDEEFKIDPITPIFEFLGSLGKGEQAWFQIIIRAHKKERSAHGSWHGYPKVDWTEGAKRQIKALKEKDKSAIGEVKISGVSMTRGEKDIIEAIERNISKVAFDVGIRVIYLAKPDNFDQFNKPGVAGIFRQFNSPLLNGFTDDKNHVTEFKYPWQDITGKRLEKRKHHLLEEYQHRSFFHKPHKGHFFTMNTEGLATIYHFPGEGVAQTPTLGRIAAKKAEPPADLPI